jgi:hypothetical protein
MAEETKGRRDAVAIGVGPNNIRVIGPIFYKPYKYIYPLFVANWYV